MTLCLINKEYVIFTTAFNGIEIEVELGHGEAFRLSMSKSKGKRSD